MQDWIGEIDQVAGELRSWFLRNVFEAAERQLGALAVTSLQAKLPPRLATHASLDRLRASSAIDSVPLEEGEEILLSVDSLLGDGSGKLLESIGIDLAVRVLAAQGGNVARAGDLLGTVARLQAFLEHPFVGVPLVFELRRTQTGFSLTVGVTGHLRATRALRHLTIGAIIAAERFAREVGADTLKIFAENVADRSTISARYLPLEEIVAAEPPPSRRPPVVRHLSGSLSAEVERILRSSSPPRSTSESDAQLPESTTFRLDNATPARGPAIK